MWICIGRGVWDCMILNILSPVPFRELGAAKSPFLPVLHRTVLVPNRTGRPNKFRTSAPVVHPLILGRVGRGNSQSTGS